MLGCLELGAEEAPAKKTEKERPWEEAESAICSSQVRTVCPERSTQLGHLLLDEVGLSSHHWV